jgi:opacity protein-like surface antigen
MYSYMFGPKLMMHRGRWTPFVQGLFGGAHATGSVSISPGAVRQQGIGPVLFGSVSEDAFAMAIGGGLDVNATKHIGVRLVQAEYFMTRFISDTQNNARISAGVVFRW